MGIFNKIFGKSDPSTRSEPWSHIQTMLQPAELYSLRDYAQNKVEGVGHLVDLGAFLGGSSAALAVGAEKNGKFNASDKKVYAFDRYILTNWLIDNYPMPELMDAKAGDSFQKVAEKNLEHWPKTIVQAADLSTYEWQDGPIELLHVDAMKNWDLTNSIFKHFFPSLIPGKSWVVHQDFVHFNTYWIHLLMHRYSEYFQPIEHVSGTTTFVFKYTKKIPQELFDKTLALDDFNKEQINAAFHASSNAVNDAGLIRFNIDGAKAMAIFHSGNKETAISILEKAEREQEETIQKHPDQKRPTELKAARNAITSD